MNYLRVALVVLLHPLKGFESFRYFRPKINILPGVILMLLTVISRFIAINYTSYQLATIMPQNANLGIEIALLLVPILTWVLSSYLITAISSGETFLYENFNAVGYCMIPYILMNLLMTALSLIFTQTEAWLFNSLNTFFIVWMLLLLFCAVLTLNDYSFGKTIGVCLLSIVFMAIIWAVALLAYALGGQMIGFVRDLINEISLISW